MKRGGYSRRWNARGSSRLFCILCLFRLNFPLKEMGSGQKQKIAEGQNQDVEARFDKQRKRRERIADGACRIVDSDRHHHQKGWFHNHIPCIPGKGDLLFQGENVHQGQKQLAGQHTDQIRHDSEFRDAKQYEGQADEKSRHVLYKRGGGLSEAV